jgi:hypothetical protein
MGAPTARLFFQVCAAIFFLPFLLQSPVAAAVAPQATSPVTQTPVQGSAVQAVPVFDESLRPALAQVGAALNQVQIDHWKLSREWKEQLRGDANSIQQDLTAQLPGLFQTVQQSPAALEPQFSVMHNVDALYDVLVRIATAANLSGGKTDAAILGNALLRLESARKTVASQLLQAASSQDRQLVRLQAQMRTAESTEALANGHTKTIVVNNRVTHPTKHHKTEPHKKAVPPSTNNDTGTSTSHTNAR